MGIAPGPVAAQATTPCPLAPCRRTRSRDALGPVPATHRPTPRAVSAEASRAGAATVRAGLLGALAVGAAVSRTGRAQAAHAQGGE